jgi:hypothetical protein
MKLLGTSFVAIAILCSTVGCSAKVETTDDSTKIEAEGPKLEVGDKPLDMDPSTDEDVDIDTPAPGDK